MATPLLTAVFCKDCFTRRFPIVSSCLKRFLLSQSGKQPYWRPVIGLEIHAQILSNSKLFSGAGTVFAAATNSQVSYFDAALPGTLPVINKRCVEAAIKTGLALNCKINLTSKFDRKHYFYGDLPAGYQITQHRTPIAVDGHLDYVVYGKHTKQKPQSLRARIIQIQMEQDSGKSLHDVEERKSLIDLNRAGVGLMEIVTAPDFTSAEEASSFVNELQLVLRTIETCDGNMAEGSMRVDANISIHAPDEPLKGIRAEVKNINSFRFVRKAIDYEIKRQTAVRESGKNIVKETRAFDFATGTTVPMRDKESQIDYRFMPEPNLLPLRLCDSSHPVPGCINVDKVLESLPQLPSEMRQDLENTYGLATEYACEIVKDGLYSLCVSVITKPGVNGSVAVSRVFSQLLNWLREDKRNVKDCSVTPSQLADLAILAQNQRISKSIMVSVLRLNYDGDPRLPSEIVENEGWWIISDEQTLIDLCRKLMTENPKAVDKYRNGKKRVINFFIGEIHKVTSRRAESDVVERIVTETLQR